MCLSVLLACAPALYLLVLELQAVVSRPVHTRSLKFASSGRAASALPALHAHLFLWAWTVGSGPHASSENTSQLQELAPAPVCVD